MIGEQTLTAADVREIVLTELRQGDLAVLVRQLQGRLSAGVGTLTWPGGSTFTNALTVPHGLPLIPVPVAIGDLPVGAFAFEVAWESRDATNIVWRGHTTDASTPAAGVQRPFSWICAL